MEHPFNTFSDTTAEMNLGNRINPKSPEFVKSGRVCKAIVFSNGNAVNKEQFVNDPPPPELLIKISLFSDKFTVVKDEHPLTKLVGMFETKSGILIAVKLVQFNIKLSPKTVMLFGKTIEKRDVHNENALEPTVSSKLVSMSENVTVSKLTHVENALFLIIVIDGGNMIFLRNSQF